MDSKEDKDQNTNKKIQQFSGFLLSTFSPKKEKFAVRDGYKIL